MFIFLSKLLPLLVYPLGLSCMIFLAAILVYRYKKIAQGLLIAALLLLFLSSNRLVSYSLARSLERQYPPLENIPQTDVIVVLGGGTAHAGYPRLHVEVDGAGDRVIYAARLYKDGKAEHLLLTGGVITWMDLNERSTPAAEMADLLDLLGVPAEAVWLEDKSQNTYENAVYSAAILEEKGINRILLVTSAMHMPRSAALFRAQGLEVIPAPADYTFTDDDWQQLLNGSLENKLISLLPNASSLSLTTNVLKEYIGIVVYRLRGWMDVPAVN